MKFTNEQIDYVKHCGEHVELLMGGRGHSKTKQIIEQLQTEKEQLNNLVNSCQQEIRNLKSTLEKIREYIKYNATSNYFDADTNMFRREVDILQIIEESDVK